MLTPHTNPTAQAAARKRELGHIHQGAASLGWSDADYRAILKSVTGKSSAADLNTAGRRAMLAHLALCGWAPKARIFRAYTAHDKMQHLWRQVAAAGVVVSSSDAALLSFVERLTGTRYSSPKFVPAGGVRTAIEALKAMLKRGAAPATSAKASAKAP